MSDDGKETVVIKGDTDQSRTLRWVQKAATKDKVRPVLTGLYVNDRAVVGCDGFRMHAAWRPPILDDHEGKILHGKIMAGDFEAEMERVEGTYPDLEAVISGSEPEYEIAINPKLLADACQGMEGQVRLRFFGLRDPMEITGTTKQGERAYALIMPMYTTVEHAKNVWRPADPPPPEEDDEDDEKGA